MALEELRALAEGGLEEDIEWGDGRGVDGVVFVAVVCFLLSS